MYQSGSRALCKNFKSASSLGFTTIMTHDLVISWISGHCNDLNLLFQLNGSPNVGTWLPRYGECPAWGCSPVRWRSSWDHSLHAAFVDKFRGTLIQALHDQRLTQYRAISVAEMMWRESHLPTTSQELFSHVNLWSAWLCPVDRKRAGLMQV